MNDTAYTTRTCIICGQKKSLTAFLELSGSKMHSYGDICASCRGSDLAAPKDREKEHGDKTSGTTRFELDNKMRMKTEQEKILLHKHKEDLDYKEKTKKEELESEKTEKEEQHEDAERKDREESLTTNNPEKYSDKKSTVQKTRGFLQEKAFTEKIHSFEAAQDQQVINQREAKKSANDLSVTYLDEQANTVKRSGSSVFAQFRKALGKSAAINRTLETYGPGNEEKTSKSKHSAGFLQEKVTQKPPEKDDNFAKDLNSSNIKKR